MKRLVLLLTLLAGSFTAFAQGYTPTRENLQRRAEFEGFRFGIFIHWGIYSTFAQGEWYLNYGITHDEYSKAADAFYPHRFDAREWVKAIKNSGAKYITFTTRHHDGFSMWDTAESDYNIVKATPFGRDVLKELAQACREEGIRLHLYYSILDWMREDYPLGRTGKETGRILKPDYDNYFAFMKRQVAELLTGYGPIGALWLDGYWDHDSDEVPFDWRMSEFYDYAHSLRPELLIGNNHHITPIAGEDFQMFERDLPGENKAGLSGQEISRLPLEMCQTMNGMWGYKVSDTNYKSSDQLIELIVRAAGKGCNLLLNIGPQPNGELPADALDRLQDIGKWMDMYGESVYGTHRGPVDESEWGVSTQKEGVAYLHVLDRNTNSVVISLDRKPKTVTLLQGECSWRYDRKSKTLTVTLPDHSESVDCIVKITR
ncbi:MAG: alpha-L-fucosidase [Alistipes sp.]|nr:alpha-L-fucosidase [Alistipes sp.]